MPKPFVHVWENGRISWICVTDPRAWPWVVAVLLRHAKRIDRGGWKVLGQAEWMAIHRSVFVPPWTSHSALLSEIIDGCDLCGKKAPYMSGWSGRCLEHKDLTDRHVQARRQRKLAASEDIERVRNVVDQALRIRDAVRGTQNRMNGRVRAGLG